MFKPIVLGKIQYKLKHTGLDKIRFGYAHWFWKGRVKWWTNSLWQCKI